MPPVEAKTFSERLETKPYFAWMLCAVFPMWLWYHFFAKSAGANINSMNITLLFLTFLLHGNVMSVSRAFESAIVSAWPILILYPRWPSATTWATSSRLFGM